jgi:cobalamin transport system permease protein
MPSRTLSFSRFAMHVGAGAAVLAAALAISPGIGTQPIGVVEAWQAWFASASGDDAGRSASGVYVIAFQLRLPRAVTAMIAGATLSLCGAVMQTLFRNVLATPYTLGIASGGALGAAIAVKLGLDQVVWGLPGDSWCALIGCAAVVAMVLLLSGTTFRLSGNSLILAGVTIGFFCSAMMMFVTYLADIRQTFGIVRWMMGSLETHGYDEMKRVLGPIALATAVIYYGAPALNQLEAGDEVAASRGVRVAALQFIVIGAASLATACVVSSCGPIGFVGLIVPQAARLIVGRDHRLLIPVVMLWGGIFLVVCDWLTRLTPRWYGLVFGGTVTAAPLPIGVMTSVIGAPVFLWLLSRRRSPRKSG